MSSQVDGLGQLLSEARAALGASLHEVAERAGCSPAYVHKLELGRVRSPSPRVLAGLARSLGIDYALLMIGAGYQAPTAVEAGDPEVPRFSNAHIVQLLENLVAEVGELRRELGNVTRSS